MSLSLEETVARILAVATAYAQQQGSPGDLQHTATLPPPLPVTVPPVALSEPVPRQPQLPTIASRAPLFAAVRHLPSIHPYIPLPMLEERTHSVLTHALANGTGDNYSSGVTVFLRFCDHFGVSWSQRLPASEPLLCNFAAYRAGSLAYSTIKNGFSALRAWHIMHQVPWLGGARLKYVLTAARHLAPPRLPFRQPVTRSMLEMLFLRLDPSKPESACALSAGSTSFWCQNRLGELFATSMAEFDPKLIPCRSALTPLPGGDSSKLLHLPSTKTERLLGEDVRILRQVGPSCPVRALENHLSVNAGPSHLPLLSYRTPTGWSCLTKRRFLVICNEVWKEAGIPNTTGHSFRIGGTTELLIRGVAPAIVQVMGRWSSDSFLKYWRNLDEIIPAHAELLDPLATPPPRRPTKGKKRVSFAS